jgi:hypothetical protein
MKQNWTLDELIDNWLLLPAEEARVNRHRSDRNKLGVALLLKYFQIAGRFPHRRRDIPQAVVSFVARQLQVSDQLLAEYNWRGRTIKFHRAAIRDFLGFREGTVADAEAATNWLVREVLPIEPTFEELIDALYERFRTWHNEWLTLDPARKYPIKLSPLPPQAKPANLDLLKRDIQQEWSMTALLEIFKEADMRINFTDGFRSTATRENLDPTTLRKRLLLCLYALGTNTGYQRMGHEVSPEMLRHIRRRYITRENLRTAIGQVVNAIFAVRAPHIWGEATTACASDSKKFAAWDQNLLTEWHVRYRGPGVMDPGISTKRLLVSTLRSNDALPPRWRP